jgi:hypothetical protein
VKKLKVTWQDGSWNTDGVQPIATAEIPEASSVEAVGDDTLVFRSRPNSDMGARLCLVIPASRLISAFVIEVAK